MVHIEHTYLTYIRILHTSWSVSYGPIFMYSNCFTLVPNYKVLTSDCLQNEHV